jgi:hypothetical protein
MNRAKEEGVEGLRGRKPPPPDAQPRLSEEQREKEVARAVGLGRRSVRLSRGDVDVREGGKDNQ